MSGQRGVCGGCGKPKHQSQAVTCVVVWAEKLERPAVLIPNDKWSICLHKACGSVERFVSRSIEGHPETQDVGEWHHAKIIFDDGEAVQVSTTPPTALA